jgi:hypothetical protein
MTVQSARRLSTLFRSPPVEEDSQPRRNEIGWSEGERLRSLLRVNACQDLAAAGVLGIEFQGRNFHRTF